MMPAMTYHGGKNGHGAFQRIISMMPPHEVYIEPFLGSGAVIRHKRPAGRFDAGFDLSRAAVDLCRTLIACNDDAGSLMLQVTCGLAYLRRSHLDRSTVIYCDPPYMQQTRIKPKVYDHEWSADDHADFLELIATADANILISAYYSQLYADRLQGWNSIAYFAHTRGSPRQEILWFNFDPPAELHDYRYLGDGFRERERINRKKKRLIAKLQRMDLFERQAVMAAIDAAGLAHRHK